jgi:hypothetical protein
VPEDGIHPRRFLEEVLPAHAASIEAELGGRSSIGSVVLHVPEEGTWSVRVLDGRLEVDSGMGQDSLLQLTVAGGDFAPLIDAGLNHAKARTASLAEMALRALSLDARTARGLRHLPGSVALVVRDGGVERRVLIAPGVRVVEPGAADCTITVAMEDWVAIQTGRAAPLTLFADGRISVSGNVQLALALGGVLG